jgi:hypothetical protein
MNKIVLKDNKVVAIHTKSQGIKDKYPGCTIVLTNENCDVGDDDPRTQAEKDVEYRSAKRGLS